MQNKQPLKSDADSMQLQFRLPTALHKKLRRRAYQENRSLAAVVRGLIEEGLRTKREPAPQPQTASQA